MNITRRKLKVGGQAFFSFFLQYSSPVLVWLCYELCHTAQPEVTEGLCGDRRAGRDLCWDLPSHYPGRLLDLFPVFGLYLRENRVV